MPNPSPPVTRTIVMPTFICTRCNHSWYPRSPEPPRVCPKCKSPYWDRPKANKQ
jgi:rubrerythrin